MAAGSQVVWGDSLVVAADDAAYGVRRIVLQPDRPAHATAGAHVDVEVPGPTRDRGGPLVRSYSVVRSEERGRRLTIAVRLSPTSRGGSHGMHALAVGDRLRTTGPLQNFGLGVGAPSYLLLAGGIGVTALVSAASALRARGADYRLVHVGRSRRVMPFTDELTAEHGDRFQVVAADEGPGLDVAALVDQVADGPHAARAELVMCGPIRLMDAVRRAWAARDLPVPNLRFETFGSSGSWEAQAFTVTIPRLGRQVRVGPDSSLLEALEGAGVPVMSDCRKGECGLCEVSVLSCTGALDHRDVFLSEEQQRADTRMCCCVSRVADPDGVRTAELSIDLP